MNAERPAPSLPPTPIFRQPIGVIASFLVLTRSVTTWCLHWTTRSRPCPGSETCAACFAGLPTRWLGYLAVQNSNGIKGLLELSGEVVDEWQRQINDLYGCIVTVSRPNRFSGARIGSVQRQLERTAEPVSIDVMDDRLCRIWGLPRMDNYESSELWHAAITRAAGAALQIELAARPELIQPANN